MKPTNLKYRYDDKVLGKFGPITFVLRTIVHERFDGQWMSYTFPWAVMLRPDAVAVLIHDKSTDYVALVEQFRPAILGTIIELVAGVLGADEDPKDCAIRETVEEVGLEVKTIEHVSTFYVSPGGTSEKIHLYYATVLSAGTTGTISGLVEEGEMVLKHVISVNKFLQMARDGQIQDAKTLLAANHLQRIRDNM